MRTTPAAWLLVIEYKNHEGMNLKLKEYHLNHEAAQNKAEQFIKNKTVTKISIQKEYIRGEVKNESK